MVEKVNLDAIASAPEFQDLVNQAVAKQLRLEREKVGNVSSDKSKQADNVNEKSKSRQVNSNFPTSFVGGVINKSPSDTTIYALALAKTQTPVQNALNPMAVFQPVPNSQQSVTNTEYTDVMQKITQFLEQMWIQGDRDQPLAEGRQQKTLSVNNELQPGPSGYVGNRGVESSVLDNQSETEGNAGVDHHDHQVGDSMDQVRVIAQKMIVDAEKYRASINKPSGNVDFQSFNRVGTGFENASGDFNRFDEEFLHLTYHVETSLIHKIEKGEYVDLEKLLPKDPTRRLSSDNRMELVNREDSTYFVPATDKDKISGI